jgi:hypothetical protein
MHQRRLQRRPNLETFNVVAAIEMLEREGVPQEFLEGSVPHNPHSTGQFGGPVGNIESMFCAKGHYGRHPLGVTRKVIHRPGHIPHQRPHCLEGGVHVSYLGGDRLVLDDWFSALNAVLAEQNDFLDSSPRHPNGPGPAQNPVGPQAAPQSDKAQTLLAESPFLRNAAIIKEDFLVSEEPGAHLIVHPPKRHSRMSQGDEETRASLQNTFRGIAPGKDDIKPRGPPPCAMKCFIPLSA